MNIAIIPARYGSKRLKLKNIKIFYNKPIIFWTIQKLIKSKIFDFIVVTSDSNRILKISKKFGANILIKRPKNLSDDNTSTKPVIVHAINYLKNKKIKKINSICCIYPCNPFVLVKDLRKAFDVFKRDNSKFVFPVTEYSHPIQRALKLNEVFGVKPIFRNNMNPS
jgi:N-acylneuraminate cytidylyltransferase